MMSDQSSGEHDGDDEGELRARLEKGWRDFVDRATKTGVPARVLVETMNSVAQQCLIELYGPQAAAAHLRLLADQMQRDSRSEDSKLLQGDEEDLQG